MINRQNTLQNISSFIVNANIFKSDLNILVDLSLIIDAHEYRALIEYAQI